MSKLEPIAVEYRPLDDLVPYARNARQHSEAQVAEIAESIRRFGFTNPILVSESGEVIAGHGRLAAAQSLRLAEAPVIVLRGLTEMERRQLVLADNRIAQNAGWDMAMLKLELSDLSAMGAELSVLGFSDEELVKALAPKGGGHTDPDDVPESEPVPVSRKGDRWICGSHVVQCGDSTVPQDLLNLMAGDLADACWTDPPYNVAYSSKLAGSIKNDDMGDEAFLAFLSDAFRAAIAVMKPGAAIYVAHADTEGLNFRAAFKAAGFKLSGCLVWAKESLVLGRSDYQWQHEPILYGWKLGAAHKWFGGRKKTTLVKLAEESEMFSVNEDGSVTISLGQTHIIVSGENLAAESFESSIVRCEKPKRSAEHPTMKPVGLIVGMLQNSTKSGDLVLDSFGGSGSTMIACETIGRRARLNELDAKYCDVIVRRWQAFTGKEATLDAEDRPTFAAVAAERVS